MRQVRFRDPAGSVRTGEWMPDGIEFGGTTYDPDEVDILPPCEPSKIVCVGLNYADHAEETNSDVPDRPLLFLKGPNTLAGHGDVVTLPPRKERVDYEGELGVVIGEQCRNVAEEDVEDVIAGYTCVNDISNRDDLLPDLDWFRGKAFENAAPVGPVVASPDLVPNDARIELRLNGEVRQESTIDNLIYSVPELVAEITQFVSLEEGDVIATGTTSGVGPLGDGDTVEIEVEGVGVLEHGVRQE